VADAEAAPAFALGRLEALGLVEEGDWGGGGGFGSVGEVFEDWGVVSNVYGWNARVGISYRSRESSGRSLRSTRQSWSQQAHLFLWPLAWSCCLVG
jgi:hypothetical protein